MSKQIEALNALIEGNGRFIQNNSQRLPEHVKGQWPRAVILSCSDSRVVPEILFDQWLGEVFVVMVAGNVARDDTVIQSLEYAVGQLKVPLLLVLGHSHCGAVALADKCVAEGEAPEGLVEEIAAGFDIDDDHVIANVKRQVKMLPIRSEIISNAMQEEELAVMGAVYDLDTGKVNMLRI